MKLKIITHEKTVFDDEADELVIDTTSGQIGVLKDHIPITTSLKIGITKAKIGEKFKHFATMGGVFQFKDNNAVILTDVCEESCDIDVARAKAAKERAEARLEEKKAELDAKRAEAALARALARLQASLTHPYAAVSCTQSKEPRLKHS